MERFVLPALSDSDECGVDFKFSLSGGCALDLGCGSGRDTVFMSQHLPPGTRVIGVDNHSYALQRGKGLAQGWLNQGGWAHSGTQDEDGPQLDLGSSLEEMTEQIDMEGKCFYSSQSGGKRTCEWILADLRKEGSLDGLHAGIVHGHRFKCEQLLPALRDEVS